MTSTSVIRYRIVQNDQKLNNFVKTMRKKIFFFVECMQGDYGDACLDKTSEAVQNSDFCKCLWNYKERYEMEASQNLYRLAAYLVSSVDETGYAQASACEVVEWQRVVVVVVVCLLLLLLLLPSVKEVVVIHALLLHHISRSKF